MKTQPLRNATRASAIRHARHVVSQLYMFGGQWRFNRWDETVNASRESNPSHYGQAVSDRSQALIDEACRYLGLDHTQYYGGNWTDYIPAAF